MLNSEKWLLLLYGLPTKTSGARVSLWRQLKKTGALPFKTSASLLPDTADHHERFQWLAQQVRDAGGEATLIRVTDIEGLGHADLVRLFDEARSRDYDALRPVLTKLLAENKRKAGDSFVAELEKLTAQFEDIRRVDFFDCPRAQDVQMLLQRAASLRVARGKASAILSPKKFKGRTWLTRPRPQIDRVGSAWLIKRFIDPQARFIFATDPARHPDALPYDMFEVEFSHHGEDCTFETLVKRFGLTDKSVLRIAEMVHDTDLEDGKFQTTECVGIDRMLKGWAKSGLSDDDLLARGGECFEALYHSLHK
ncbi:MAG: hypothetical protein QOF48_3058 [Verrucomicrobiota bacterium]